MNDVDLAQKKEALGLGGLVVAGAIIWAVATLIKEKAPPAAPAIPGPANLEGGISQVEIRQGQNLTFRQLLKIPGEEIQVIIDLKNAVTDFGGAGIPWDFKLITRLGHSVFLGWKTSGELGFAETGIQEVSVIGAAFGITNNLLAAKFSTPDDPDQIWDVRVELQMADTDSVGLPTTTFISPPANPTGWITEVKADGAIQGAALPSLSGGVANIEVRQKAFGRLGGR